MNTKEMRELDAWIAGHVMGLKRVTFNTFWNSGLGAWECQGPTGMQSVHHYTTDPAAAMKVLEKCAESAQLTICIGKTEGGFKLWLPNRFDSAIEAPTLPLAICLFARKLFDTKP